MQAVTPIIVRGAVGFLRLFAVDKRSLALFRICMGLVTIYDVMQRFPDIHNHYGDRGIISRSLALDKFNNYYWMSVHMLAGNDFYMQILFLLHAFVGFCMMVGYKTRLMTFFNWMLVCSLQNRNYVVCHSGDTVQRVMLFWAMFLPIGEYFSLDSIWKKKSKKDQRLTGNTEVLGVATIAFTIQIYVMYATAHFHKSGAEWRELGTATWMALQLDFFRTWVGDLFALFPALCKALTFFVLYWQVSGTIMYFLPVGKYSKYLKAFSVFGFICMHLGFGMCLALEQFTWVTEASLMGLIPGFAWDEAIKYFEKNQKKAIQIHYLQRCKFCTNVAEVSGMFMLPKSKVIPTDILPGRIEHGFLGITVIDANRVQHNGPDIFEVIAKSSPVLYPLHYIFRTKAVKAVIYTLSQQLHYHKITHTDVEAANKQFGDNQEPANIDITVDNTAYNNSTPYNTDGTSDNGASILESGQPQPYSNNSNINYSPTPKKRKMFKNESLNMYAIRKTLPIVFGVVVEALLAFLLFLVITWNFGNIQMYEYATPHALRPVLWVTQLDQYWGMFAPRPPDVMWWYNIEAELDDGTTAELFNDGAMFTFEPNIPHTFAKPKSLHASMGNHRWFKLFENGLNSHDAREELRLNFGRWFCREYNNRHHEKKRLYKFNIHWMNERIDPELKDTNKRIAGPKQTIWSHICYDK